MSGGSAGVRRGWLAGQVVCLARCGAVSFGPSHRSVGRSHGNHRAASLLTHSTVPGSFATESAWSDGWVSTWPHTKGAEEEERLTGILTDERCNWIRHPGSPESLPSRCASSSSPGQAQARLAVCGVEDSSRKTGDGIFRGMFVVVQSPLADVVPVKPGLKCGGGIPRRNQQVTRRSFENAFAGVVPVEASADRVARIPP